MFWLNKKIFVFSLLIFDSGKIRAASLKVPRIDSARLSFNEILQDLKKIFFKFCTLLVYS